MTLAKSDSRRHFLGMRDVLMATAIAALGFSATLAAGQSNTQKPAAAAPTSATRHLAAPQTGQQTFSSAEEASQVLVTAMKNNDQQSLLKVLGPNAKEYRLFRRRCRRSERPR